MKAMVLAAGLGTRLRPLTDHTPKALVEIGGRTLLEITLKRLRDFGIRDVIINAHHFAAAILDYLKKNDNFGMRVEISKEDVLLDTGGGLKKAGWFFLQDSRGKDEAFLLHNVDAISTIDFGALARCHNQSGALATLAVKVRKTSRYLLFDEKSQLCGRRIVKAQEDEMVCTADRVEALGFTGIHVICSRMLTMMKEEGAFSIIDFYLRLAREGQTIRGFRADQYYWRDLGKLEQVKQAEQDYTNGLFS
jgi:mannose-1-phosphate guanylyltransferase